MLCSFPDFKRNDRYFKKNASLSNGKWNPISYFYTAQPLQIEEYSL
jgi:hypothetical protein